MQSSKSKKFGGFGLGVWFLIILATVGVTSSVGIVVHRQKKKAMMVSTTMVSTIEPECEETPAPVMIRALVHSVPDAAAAVSTPGYEKNGDKGTKQSLLKSDQVKKDLGVVGVLPPCPGGKPDGDICTQTPQDKCANSGQSTCTACAAQTCPGSSPGSLHLRCNY